MAPGYGMSPVRSLHHERLRLAAGSSRAGSGQCSRAHAVRSSSASATASTPSSSTAATIASTKRCLSRGSSASSTGHAASSAAAAVRRRRVRTRAGKQVRRRGGERVLRPPAGSALPAAASGRARSALRHAPERGRRARLRERRAGSAASRRYRRPGGSGSTRTRVIGRRRGPARPARSSSALQLRLRRAASTAGMAMLTTGSRSSVRQRRRRRRTSCGRRAAACGPRRCATIASCRCAHVRGSCRSAARAGAAPRCSAGRRAAVLAAGCSRAERGAVREVLRRERADPCRSRCAGVTRAVRRARRCAVGAVRRTRAPRPRPARPAAAGPLLCSSASCGRLERRVERGDPLRAAAGAWRTAG